MKTKLSPKFWLALTAFSLIGQVAWVVENMYLNVFIYKMFNASAADISAMVAASAVAATLTTVFIGALSDKIGKRKLFMCGGYILWGISILAFALLKKENISSLFPMATSAAAVGVSLVIILDCVMTFFGSSANDAAFNAWLTDSTDDSNRGAAEGINAMMPLVAILAVFGGFMAFNLNEAESWTYIFAIIGGVVLAIGILGFFIIKEPRLEPVKESYLRTVLHGFLPSTVRSAPSLYIHLIAFIIFNISIQIFMPYLIIYYEVSLKMTNYVFIMAPAIVIASVVTAFWGKVYDKKGFSLSSLCSLIWLSAGYVILYCFKNTAFVFVGSLFMMCGYLSGMAVFGAKIRDLTPIGKSGMFQGVRIFSQVLIPGIVGPFIGRTVLANAQKIINNDGTESFVPNENIFLAALGAIVLLSVFLIIFKSKDPPRTVDLETDFESDTSSSWETEHPRPQLKRASFDTLCGKWELSELFEGQETHIGSISVPFPPESRISGIKRSMRDGAEYVYKKSFTIDEPLAKNRLLIHFGAVDQIAEVFINGKSVGSHTGGYLPFSFDITNETVVGENTVSVRVIDNLDRELAYGKQRRDRGGMWYTPISGIWQPVWLERVPEKYIASLKIKTTLDSVTIETSGGEPEKLLSIDILGDKKEYRYTGDSITVKLDSPVLWTPESPHLYPFSIVSGNDSIESYFALRTVSIKKYGERSYICLNKKPYFFHGLLDQGYFSDGIYTPASPSGYKHDILTMKSLGFNMLRKHIKIEPDIFYYYCDKYGMAVFQDMVNSGKYSYIIDTVLPTAGIKKGISHKASEKRRSHFESDSAETVSLLYNHPSVCYYTIFNEGWGQYDADRVAQTLQPLDDSRIWDTTSGWFNEKISDVKSEHVYFRRLNLRPDPERPLVLSEFGGYSCKIPLHSFNLDKTYGYKFLKTPDELFAALESLYLDEVVSMIDRGLSAAVITQVSDVEDETNGLMTYDRKVLKVDAAKMSEVSKKLYSAFYSKFE